GGTQHLAVDLDLAVGADRHHRLVVGEAAIDQLAGEGDIVALDPDVVAADFQFQLAIAAFQQALQFGDALARHDDLALHARAGIERGFTQGQARSEEHTSELQSRENLVCRLLLEKKNTTKTNYS